MTTRSIPILILSIITLAVLQAQGGEKTLPPDDSYVTIDQDGHLSAFGKRERYWAAIGKVFIRPDLNSDDSPEERHRKIADAKRGTEVIIDHLSRLGFNSVRLWEVLGEDPDYEIGDGSRADSVDHFIHLAKERGFRIWSAGVGNRTGFPKLEDVEIIEDSATAEEWKAAIAETLAGERKLDLRHNLARVWDPRLEAIVIQRMRQNADHLNKYTGLRWSDDPVFAVWELTNEEWWVRRMVGGQWQKLPVFFRNQLVRQWNHWLLDRYRTQEKLIESWGPLLPGEDLKEGTVLFAPMAGATKAPVALNDANEQARAAVTAINETFTRQDFSKQRAADVLEFLVGMQGSHKQRLAEAFKSFGKSTALSPLIHDTGIGYEIQSQWLHQNADAVAHNAYVNGWGPPYREPEMADPPAFSHQNLIAQLNAERISANSGPWINWLRKPPGIAQGVPWLEHNRTEGKPFLAYETQIQQPAKYRADFPLRLAALAAIQDWDWICWHFFSPHDQVGSEANPFARALDVTTGDHPQGYHFTYDEVQGAMMRAAAYVFRNGLLQEAPDPTQFIYGRRSLFDPDSMDYAGSYGKLGMDMLQTTYQYGTRIKIDPSRMDDAVEGPVVSFADRSSHNPYTPTSEIIYDWQRGFLSLSAPGLAAFAGGIAPMQNRHEFENGVVLSNVHIENPEGIFDPIKPEENYLAFAYYSRDGKPLDICSEATISVVSTSFNTGFILGKEMGLPHKAPIGTEAGSLPVLVSRVGATIESVSLQGMTYTFRDWNNQVIATGKIEDGRLIIPASLPVFSAELTR